MFMPLPPTDLYSPASPLGRMPGQRQSAKLVRGFTLIEILFSILIIGVLMGLLFVAFRSTRRYASSVDARSAVSAVRMGVIRFKDQFGFVPPLLRDQAAINPRSVVTVGTAPGFAAYNFSSSATNAADLLILRPAALVNPALANPFQDPRYSERSLAVYIAGVCEVPLDSNAADPLARSIPLDGVAGPGFCKPSEDGNFVVPASIRAGTAATSRRGGVAKFESLLDLNSKSLSPLWFQRELDTANPPPASAFPRDGDDAADPDKERWVAIADLKRTPLRFYRWINGAAYTQGAQTVYEVRIEADFRVPPLVGRLSTLYPGTPADRDISLNPGLKNATWAIVSAGPDGAFGDEPLDLLAFRLKVAPIADERKVRIEAERDNLIEVGE